LVHVASFCVALRAPRRVARTLDPVGRGVETPDAPHKVSIVKCIHHAEEVSTRFLSLQRDSEVLLYL